MGYSKPSGQIIATSHDLGPQKVAKEGKPLDSGKSRLVKYYNFGQTYHLGLDMILLGAVGPFVANLNQLPRKPTDFNLARNPVESLRIKCLIPDPSA